MSLTASAHSGSLPHSPCPAWWVLAWCLHALDWHREAIGTGGVPPWRLSRSARVSRENPVYPTPSRIPHALPGSATTSQSRPSHSCRWMLPVHEEVPKSPKKMSLPDSSPTGHRPMLGRRRVWGGVVTELFTSLLFNPFDSFVKWGNAVGTLSPCGSARLAGEGGPTPRLSMTGLDQGRMALSLPRAYRDASVSVSTLPLAPCTHVAWRTNPVRVVCRGQARKLSCGNGTSGLAGHKVPHTPAFSRPLLSFLL